jgi:hypothetical protein
VYEGGIRVTQARHGNLSVRLRRWIVRAVSYGDAPCAARVASRLVSGPVAVSDLAKTLWEALKPADGTVSLSVRPSQIATLRVQVQEPT